VSSLTISDGFLVDDSEFPPLLGTRPAEPGSLESGVLMPPRGPRTRKRVRGSLAKSVSNLRALEGEESLNVLRASVPREGEILVSKITRRYRDLVAKTGVEFALRDLKKTSAACRSTWILRGGSDVSAQCSFLGRSLPRGTPDAVREAIDQHTRDLGVGWTTPDGVLGRARLWARRWATRKLPKRVHMAAPDMPTLSSCVESTVKEGGLRGYVLSLGLHPRAAALFEDPGLCSGLPLQDIQSLVSDLNLAFHGIDLYSQLGDTASVVVGLVERGLKTRIITKSPACVHLLGHIVRKRLLAGLRKDRSSASVLAGVSDEEIIAHYVGSVTETLVSTDLTRASDLLPLDLMSALAEGIFSSGKLCQIEYDALLACIGRQWVVTPDGTKYLSSRGILMGLPTTWAMLSIAHLFWWEDSICMAARRKGRTYSDAFKENRFMVCGDDALFAGWKLTSKLYDEVVAHSGGSKSPGKHYELQGADRPRGVFLERLFEFSQVGGFITGGSRNSAFPLMGLVHPEVPDELRGHGPKISVTWQIKMFFAIDSIWAQHPASEKGLSRLVSKLWPGLRSHAKSLGLTNGLALRYGGCGIPIDGPVSKAARLRWASAILAEDQGISLPSLIRGTMSSAWQIASELAEADLSQFLESKTFVILEDGADPTDLLGADPPYVNSGPERDVRTAFATEAFRMCIYSFGEEFTERRLHAKELKRTVDYFVSRLPKGSYGAWVDEVILKGPTKRNVWIQRTIAPNGDLLYPRWVGETLASEALQRSRIFGGMSLQHAVSARTSL